MSFLGMGPLEIIIILLIAFIVLGPEKMIESARWMGKTVGELRRMVSELPTLTEEDFQPNPITRKADQSDEKQAAPPSDQSTTASDNAEENGQDGPVAFKRTSSTANAKPQTTPESDKESQA